MLDMVMFLVEEEKADESQIPILNKDRLLMSFASVDHYRVRETHVKFNVPPLYALPCYYFGDERLPVNGTMTRLTVTGRITRWQ